MGIKGLMKLISDEAPNAVRPRVPCMAGWGLGWLVCIGRVCPCLRPLHMAGVSSSPISVEAPNAVRVHDWLGQRQAWARLVCVCVRLVVGAAG